MDFEAILAGVEDVAESHGTLNMWTEEEDHFVEANIAYLGVSGVAEALGRSENAVVVRMVREGLARPTTAIPDEMSSNQVAVALGFGCSKKVGKLVDNGLMPGRLVPVERTWYGVRYRDLKRWVIRPSNWIIAPPEKYKDPHLRRLALLAKERWGDDWWTTGQVAKWHQENVDSRVRHTDVNRYIRAGKLPASQYGSGNWRVKRSDAMAVRFPKGTGKGHELDWSGEGDKYMVLAWAVGVPPVHIARRMGWGDAGSRVDFRVKYLHGNGRLPDVPIQVDECLFADWRDHQHRFPGLVTAVGRFVEGEQLDDTSTQHIRRILLTWLRWHAPPNPQLERKLSFGQNIKRETLLESYEAVIGLGVPDPFQK